MRKIKRTRDYELTLLLPGDDFIHAPRDAQRQWLVQRAVQEFGRDLDSLAAIAPRMVPGAEYRAVVGSLQTGIAVTEDGKLKIDGQSVMEDWQPALMHKLAEAAASRGGDVLEVGFGLGISATRIQEIGVRSHTIIECNASVARSFDSWATQHSGRDIRMVPGTWQDLVGTLGKFDGILFDTYPLTQADFDRSVTEDVTYAQHFFAAAAAHLKPGGVFTYFTGEIDSLSRAHQRLLLQHFSEFTVGIVRGLEPARDSSIWWFPTMAVVRAFA